MSSFSDRGSTVPLPVLGERTGSGAFVVWVATVPFFAMNMPSATPCCATGSLKIRAASAGFLPSAYMISGPLSDVRMTSRTNGETGTSAELTTSSKSAMRPRVSASFVSQARAASAAAVSACRFDSRSSYSLSFASTRSVALRSARYSARASRKAS